MKTKLRIFVSAGEPSGEVMAAFLEQELVRLEPGCDVSRLQAPRALGPVLGFSQGLRAAGRVKTALAAAEGEVRATKPDVVVLVSFSGFHMPLGRRLRAAGVPVLYLGPPQVWAWGGMRARRLRRAADKVVCLFGFEEPLLQRAGVDAVYHGYPLLDAVTSSRSQAEVLSALGFGSEERYVVFLPGSRPEEVMSHAALFGDVQERLRGLMPGLRFVEVAYRQPPGADRFDTMRYAEAAVAVSGTVTAELAILGVPMVVCYHLSFASRVVARLLVRTRYFALPNILAGRKVVPEYLEPRPEVLAREVASLLADTERRRQMTLDLQKVTETLGPAGSMAAAARGVLVLARTHLSARISI